MNAPRTLCVAAVQLACRVGAPAANLAHARDLVEQAAAKGARLILLPELLASGYSVSPRIWDRLEPPDGPTAQWLRVTAAHLGVYLGASFAEQDAGDVWNTFVLAQPDGTEAGRVRKSHAETYFFRSGKGSHVLETRLGRIGVGVCADCQYADFARAMRIARVDLLLLPHAAPAARVVGGPISAEDVRRQHALLAGIAPRYARWLGAPVVFANQCGPTVGTPGTGLIGRFVDTDHFHFPGLSAIADSDSTVVSRLNGAEGLAVGRVAIDPARRPEGEPAYFGQWATRGSSPFRGALTAIDGALGRAYYRLHHPRA